MELLDRYLQAVEQQLPKGQRDDILRELSDDLRSQIEERESLAGRPLDEGEMAELIRRSGHPMLLAARYRRQQLLIGPALFPYYLLTLKSGLWAAFLVSVTAGVLLLAGGDRVRQIAQGGLHFFSTALVIFALVTIAFALLERANVSARVLDNWNPRKLPAPSAAKPISRQKSASELISSFVLLWWVPALLDPTHEYTHSFVVTVAPVWHQIYVPVLVILIVRIAQEGINVVEPHWVGLRSAVRVFCDVVTLGCIAVVIQSPTLIVLQAFIPNPVPFEKLIALLNQIAFYGLVLSALGCVWEISREARGWFSRRSLSARVLSALAALLIAGVTLEGAQEDPGARLYQQHCAKCHDAAAPQARVPTRGALRKLTPEAISVTLNEGVMKPQAAALSALDRWAVAKWLGTPSVQPVAAEKLTHRCPASLSSADPDSAAHAWTSWGVDPANSRFQPAAAGGLSAETVPHLKLKWAFGLAKVDTMRSQPAVADGRVYLGGNDGILYALDAATGCVHWETLGSPVRSALVLAPAGSTPAVFFGDPTGFLNALDRATGKLLWRTKVDEHPAALVTGAPAYADGRLFVPVSSYEEASAVAPDYPCCTFRGSVVALDAATGKIAWKFHTIAEESKPQGKTEDGRTRFGPSGAAVWASPTVDGEKPVLYLASGDNYTEPATATSDALLALDRNTGKLLWSRQFTRGDAFNVSCAIPGKVNCPANPGGDFDFGASPMLLSRGGGKRAILMAQKSGMVYAVDPDRRGETLWEARAGRGGALGGVQWGAASDGKAVFVAVSDIAFGAAGLAPDVGGGISAFALDGGSRLWKTAAPGCAERKQCSPAQSAAVTAVPGAVFSGSLDGHLRAYAASDGRVLWDFDTARPFPAVNEVPAKGGSLDAAGAVVAGGMVFAVSGYPQYGGMPGNVLLAFEVAR